MLCLWVASAGLAFDVLRSPKGAEQYLKRRLRRADPPPLPTTVQVFALPRLAIVPLKPITNTLAWDYPTNWNQVSNILLYRGDTTNFTRTNSVGKVLTTTVTRTNVQYFAVTAVGTNGLESEFSNLLRVPTLIVHVTVSGGATNLYHATSLAGPWSPLGTTNYWVTNQFGVHYYRGKGKSGNRVIISGQTQQ